MHGVCAGALIMSLAAGASAFCSMPCSISAGIAAASSCATRQPLPMLRESLQRGGAAMTAKKKKGAKKKDNGGVSVSEDSEDTFDGVLPQRDKSLEAMMDFDDIPKEALVPSRSIAQNDKDKARAGPDPDSVFGLPGDAVRFVKKGTYATLALMVLALVVVRSPLMNIIAPDAGKLELAKKAEREALDKQGKALPGVRPFPSLQLTPEEEEASGGSAVKVVDDATLGKSEGLEINIGGGQKIKMVPKKPAQTSRAKASDASKPVDADPASDTQ